MMIRDDRNVCAFSEPHCDNTDAGGILISLDLSWEFIETGSMSSATDSVKS